VKNEPTWEPDYRKQRNKDQEASKQRRSKKTKVKKEKSKKVKHDRVKRESKKLKHERVKHERKKEKNRPYREREKVIEQLKEEEDSEEESTVEMPDFKPSGALKRGTIYQKNGFDLKYLPPSEAQKPNRKFRIYELKDGEEKDVYHLHRKDHFIFGRNSKVCDIPLKHLSISKQHAVLQYRRRSKTTATGQRYDVIDPYLIDLETTHGTKINGEKMKTKKYYQLLSEDVIKFGLSSRDYIFLPQDVIEVNYEEGELKTETGETLVVKSDDEEEDKFQIIKKDKPEKPKPENMWDL